MDIRFDEKDEDLNLIPQLITKVVVPRVASLLGHSWNPRSKRESVRALNLVKEILDIVDPKSDTAKELLNSVLVSIQYVIELLPKKIQGENVDKQVKNSLKLLMNLSMWQGYLPTDTIQRIIIDNLLNMQLLPFLNKLDNPNQMVEICEQIVMTFPRQWTKDAGSLDRIGLFRYFILNNLLKKVEKNRELLQRTIQLIGNMNDKETEKQLKEKYQI
jgi:GC-rich sequence DNA-binding factor